MTIGGLAGAEDRELLARAMAGDDVAFGELLRRHQGAALRVAGLIAGSTDEAADIVQGRVRQGSWSARNVSWRWFGAFMVVAGGRERRKESCAWSAPTPTVGGSPLPVGGAIG